MALAKVDLVAFSALSEAGRVPLRRVVRVHPITAKVGKVLTDFLFSDFSTDLKGSTLEKEVLSSDELESPRGARWWPYSAILAMPAPRSP
jgi:hypothetical protein